MLKGFEVNGKYWQCSTGQWGVGERVLIMHNTDLEKASDYSLQAYDVTNWFKNI